jgi:hypothetical protein
MTILKILKLKVKSLFCCLKNVSFHKVNLFIMFIYFRTLPTVLSTKIIKPCTNYGCSICEYSMYMAQKLDRKRIFHTMSGFNLAICSCFML